MRIAHSRPSTRSASRKAHLVAAQRFKAATQRGPSTLRGRPQVSTGPLPSAAQQSQGSSSATDPSFAAASSDELHRGVASGSGMRTALLDTEVSVPDHAPSNSRGNILPWRRSAPTQEQKQQQQQHSEHHSPVEVVHSDSAVGVAAAPSSTDKPWWHVDRSAVVAVALLGTWASMVHYTVFHVPLDSFQAAALFFPMMQLHTGVFITAHEAMHGTVAPSNPRLNDFLGTVACTLYAGLDFQKMRVSHRQHHAHTGIQGGDPDFHTGNPSLGPWALGFMRRYLNLKQIIILNVMVGAMQISGAPYFNMVVFLLAAGLLSAAQLFYFGTYIPHRPPKDSPGEVMHWEKAATSVASSRLGSLLTCYSFDCHYEHHANPRVPWYQLWDERVKRLSE